MKEELTKKLYRFFMISSMILIMGLIFGAAFGYINSQRLDQISEKLTAQLESQE